MNYSIDTNINDIIGTSSSYDTVFAGVLGFIVVLLLVVGVFAIIALVAKAKMYKKAGQPGWAVIIPFYSEYVYTKVAGVNWWWMFVLCATTLVSFTTNYNTNDGSTTISGLSSLLSLASTFGYLVCNYNIAKKLHKDIGYAVLMTLFAPIMWMVIGFSSMSFDQNVEVTLNGLIDGNKETSSNQGTPVKEAKVKESSSNEGAKFCPNCGTKLDKGAKFCGSCGKQL